MRMTLLSRIWLTLVCVLLSLHHGRVSGQSVAAEGQAQGVQVTIYETDVDEWTRTSLVQRIASISGQTYCSASPINCGLVSFSGFNVSSDVVISSPTKDGYSIVVTVYILYPAGDPVHPNSSTQYVLPSAATTAILQNTREGYHRDTGLWMTYINGQYYSIPPDVEVNQTVIPLAFLVVIGTAITAAFLNYHEKRQERRDKLKKRMQEKKRIGAVTNYINSNYNILETTNTTVVSNTPRPVRYSNAKIVPDDTVNYDMWNVDKETPTSKSVPQISAIPSANQYHRQMTSHLSVNEFHSQVPSHPSVNDFHSQGTALPSVNEFHSQETALPSVHEFQETPRTKNGLEPLEHEADLDVREKDAERKERRRRRKEKRREKQRLREMEVYDNHAVDSSVLSDNENNTSGNGIQTFSVEKEERF